VRKNVKSKGDPKSRVSEEDGRWMERAIALARRGAGEVSPNPLVGAVLVRGGAVVGDGFHARFGGPHAEVMALRQGADLYVTLEPCVDFPGKKTPPCVQRILESRVRRVFVATLDPNPQVHGRGVAVLRKHGVLTEVGLCRKEAERLNRPYCKFQKTGLPYLIAKWAMTLDGKIATRTGDSKWITNEAARQFARGLRRRCQAVLIGSETVLKDDPRILETARIVLDRRGRISTNCRLIKTADKQQTILARSSNLTRTLRKLGEMGFIKILIEGGGEVHASAFAAGLVDEVYAFVAPRIIGGRDAKTPVEGRGLDKIRDALNLRSIDVRSFGDNFLIHGLV
jgi:diaminohydroxyphosphoribosylaminopyrimidine deaminase/5-amino-6-(5-phosphoribosylamino)uracil reductase